jgi:hypothetical protein
LLLPLRLEANFGFILNWVLVLITPRLVAPVKRVGDFAHENVLKITTDQLAAYKPALKKHFAPSKYHYLQIVKQRFKRRLVTVNKGFVSGTETDFPKSTPNTSFIERFNLTLRQHVSYLTRTTLGYCKNRVNFKNILLINIYHYNYIQFNKSLRQKITESPQEFTTKILGLTQSNWTT